MSLPRAMTQLRRIASLSLLANLRGCTPSLSPMTSIVMPTFKRKETGGGRLWSLLIPVYSYNGRGYDIANDEYKYGPWRFYIRLTIERRYGQVMFCFGWGSYLV